LTCCDKAPINFRKPTYVNDALNHESTIDYFFTSDDAAVTGYDVIDPDINFSDHLPIKVNCTFDIMCGNSKHNKSIDSDSSSSGDVLQLRWDYADVVSYYLYTGSNLQPVMADIDNLLVENNNSVDVRLRIDIIYANIVKVLRDGAKIYVPARKKLFF